MKKARILGSVKDLQELGGRDEKKTFYLPFCFVGIFPHANRLDAYSTTVHEMITKEVIDHNGNKLDVFINDYIGLSNGTGEFINSKRISKNGDGVD